MTTIRSRILGMAGMTPSEHKREHNAIMDILSHEYQETSIERKAYRKMVKSIEIPERRIEYIADVDELLGNSDW